MPSVLSLALALSTVSLLPSVLLACPFLIISSQFCFFVYRSQHWLSLFFHQSCLSLCPDSRLVCFSSALFFTHVCYILVCFNGMKNLCVCITEAFASITVYNRKLSLLISVLSFSLSFSRIQSCHSLSCPSAHSLSLFISELSLSLSCSQHYLSPLGLDSSLKQQEEQTEVVFLRFASFSSLSGLRGEIPLSAV